MSGVTTEHFNANDGRHRGDLPRLFWPAFGALLLVLAGLVASSFWLKSGTHDGRVFTFLAIDELTSVFLVFALTPVVFRLAHRSDPRVLGWTRTIAWHSVGFATFCALHVVGMNALRILLYQLAGGTYSSDALLDVVLYESRKDALTYAGLVAAAWILPHLFAGSDTEETRKPLINRSARIEFRNGATRVWLLPQEILWVEAAGNYVELMLENRTVLHRDTLSNMETLLAASGFRRIHRSRLINTDRIVATSSENAGDYRVTLDNGRTLRGSRRYRATLEAIGF